MPRRRSSFSWVRPTNPASSSGAGRAEPSEPPARDTGDEGARPATEIARWAEAIGAAHVLAGASPTAPSARR
ncbi:MAG: hypothetical protein HOV73_29530 [Streptomyces sp.]|nr:hypothetical protein [Streptomyces sp.]